MDDADRALSHMAFADPASFLKGLDDGRVAQRRGRRGRAFVAKELPGDTSRARTRGLEAAVFGVPERKRGRVGYGIG